MRFCFEKVRRLFRWFHSLIWKRRLELALVGLDDSGKTTFTNYLKNGRFPQHAMSTVGFHFQKIVRGKQTFKICDLGGLPRFRSLWPRYCMGQDAILFMLDAKNRLRLLQAKWELEQLMNAPQLEGIPLLVLANKTEYGGKGDAPIGVEELANELALDQIGCGRPVGCIGISCKEGRNIDEAVQWLLRYARH